MTVTLDELNSLPASEAADLFLSCCGSGVWAKEMVKGRPYGSIGKLLDTADRAWSAATPDEIREAFKHHPRIGESDSAAPQSATAKAWSKTEQSKLNLASSNVHDQMSLVNSAYESRFGYTYIVSAMDKTADDMLGLARKRLRNDPERELKIAAGEQGKITRLRLKRLLGAE
jgi:2-oxo-4-hydroxy-4-carboxy-5-ureidoimidazoline decarboxylase